MNCKICDNPLMDTDKGLYVLKSNKRYGICDACWEKQQNDEEYEEKSKTAMLGIIGILLLIGGIGVGIYFLTQNLILTGLIYIVMSLVIFAFIKGFSDIIDLLDDINSKIK